MELKGMKGKDTKQNGTKSLVLSATCQMQQIPLLRSRFPFLVAGLFFSLTLFRFFPPSNSSILPFTICFRICT